MPSLRVALALPIALTLACSDPPTPAQQAKPNSEPKASPSDPAPPKRAALKSKTITPPDDLLAKDVPPPPSLASVTLPAKTTGTLPLPEGIGVVLPHVALQLEQGLLIAGQAYVDYDPKIRATEVWQLQAFVPTHGDPRASKGEAGAIRAGILDGKGGALLVGSLGVGLSARAWAATIASNGDAGPALPLEPQGYSDVLAVLGGGPTGELAVLGGFADTSASLLSIDDAGAKRWQPMLVVEGFPQIRALARIDDQAVLAIGTVAQREGAGWWVRIPADGSAAEQGTIDLDAIEGTKIDSNRTMVALADRGPSGLVGLGLAKRGLVQDHDQVFAVGFDRRGKIEWARAIDQVRATQVRGAIGWQGAALFVLEVPAGEATALALLRVAGSGEADVKVEQLAGSEGKRSPGFVQGANPPEILIADTRGTMSWQRLEVSP